MEKEKIIVEDYDAITNTTTYREVENEYDFDTTILLIESLKAQLEATKDKVIDFVEGVITEEEYAPIKAEREDLRERIRELEAEI